jgi:N6-adenosine-specific RNA methylase IME4
LSDPFPDIPRNAFNVIYADPPWSFNSFSKKGEGRAPVRHYQTMKLPEIKALPVGDLAAKDCHLFMWTTGPNLEQAFEVMKAWGFQYSSVAFTWVKLWNSRADTLFMTDNDFVIGLGHTTRKNTEYCLLGRKGSPKRRSKSVRELLIAARREHSRKPDEAVRRIEEYADGPYLELFARTSRPNWTAWGNQTDRFPEAVA